MTNCLCFCCFYCKFYIYIFMCCGTLYVELWLCSIKKSNKFMEFWEFYAAYTIKEICALCNIGSLTYKLMLLMCLTKKKKMLLMWLVCSHFCSPTGKSPLMALQEPMVLLVSSFFSWFLVSNTSVKFSIPYCFCLWCCRGSWSQFYRTSAWQAGFWEIVTVYPARN